MNTNNEDQILPQILVIGETARVASHALAILTNEEKNKSLQLMASSLRKNISKIVAANFKDMELAKDKNLPSANLDRLLLTTRRIEDMAQSLEKISELPNPIGRVLQKNTRPNKLEISKITVPIGVIGVIYESRPNVTSDAAGLCMKSGNAVILRGGSDCFYSSLEIISALHAGISQTKVPVSAVQIIPTPERFAVSAMLKLDKYIDVIIPRGGTNLINFVSTSTKIPVLKHLAGVCHTYIHAAADLAMAKKITINAKMRRPGICGATEILLVDAAILHSHLPEIIDELLKAGCEIRGDHHVRKLNSNIKSATDIDFDTEFLSATIAIKVVADLAAAIKHIAHHSTQHTDAIITADQTAADKFLNEVDSAIVMHNSSTQFADGGEFGMGAEIGIATGKLHARGPVGVEQLTTFKYLVRGNGQIRS